MGWGAEERIQRCVTRRVGAPDAATGTGHQLRVPDDQPVRGFVVGLLLLPVLVIALLSIRPGGLRQQLRNAARRLRLALILAGIYMAASTVARVVAPTSEAVENGLIALAAVLAVVFVILGQDPRPAAGEPAAPAPPGRGDRGPG